MNGTNQAQENKQVQEQENPAVSLTDQTPSDPQHTMGGLASEQDEDLSDAQEQEQEEQEETVDQEGVREAQLLARIAELEQRIADSQQLLDRVDRECAEFESYFPDVSLRQIPEQVWKQVHAGVPLSAAYALYERGQQQQRVAAQERNAKNASLCLGVPDAAGQEYFSPAQVRAMSPGEVRENYDRIFESMRHWQ